MVWLSAIRMRWAKSSFGGGGGVLVFWACAGLAKSNPVRMPIPPRILEEEWRIISSPAKQASSSQEQ
jgi:hypothetical protein